MATERSSGAGGQRGVNRVLTKLENSIDQGDYYEAHQMYRTLYFRYTTQKKFQECLDLLFSGATKLLTKKQQGSAADLCLLIVDTLEKRDDVKIDDDDNDTNDAMTWITRLGTLIGGFGANVVERETIIQRAVKWSCTVCDNTLGHPALHKAIAQVFWNERNTDQARHHFLLCQDGKLCGSILVQINQTKGYDSEADLYIVQAVLQQLCLKERHVAEETFIAYTQNHPLILRPQQPYKQPLLNFIYFLFRLIDLKRLSSFRVLKKLYEPSLKRDQAFKKYLYKIGAIYFGEVQTQTTGMGGMFGDIFQRLFQDLEDDEGEAEVLQHSITQSQRNELD